MNTKQLLVQVVSLSSIIPNGTLFATFGLDDFNMMVGLIAGRNTFSTIRCESVDVSGATVASWNETLPEIVKGYNTEDIWSLDESGGHLQGTSGFGQKVKECKGGKRHRFTVTFMLMDWQE